MKKISMALVLVFAASVAAAQDRDEWHEAVETFVRSQTQSLPGKVSIKVGSIDQRLNLAACATPEAFLPPGGHLLGNGTVGLRCPASRGHSGWTVFVPVQVKVSVTLLIANKALPQGHVMTLDDITGQSGELTQSNLVTDPSQVTGQILTHGVGRGQLLRLDMLRPPYAIKQGQAVQLRAAGAGFKVGYEGHALANAAENQTLQVRTPSNHVVTGVARENGVVEISP